MEDPIFDLNADLSKWIKVEIADETEVRIHSKNQAEILCIRDIASIVIKDELSVELMHGGVNFLLAFPTSTNMEEFLELLVCIREDIPITSIDFSPSSYRERCITMESFVPRSRESFEVEDDGYESSASVESAGYEDIRRGSTSNEDDKTGGFLISRFNYYGQTELCNLVVLENVFSVIRFRDKELIVSYAIADVVKMVQVDSSPAFCSVHLVSPEVPADNRKKSIMRKSVVRYIQGNFKRGDNALGTVRTIRENFIFFSESKQLDFVQSIRTIHTDKKNLLSSVISNLSPSKMLNYWRGSWSVFNIVSINPSTKRAALALNPMLGEIHVFGAHSDLVNGILKSDQRVPMEIFEMFSAVSCDNIFKRPTQFLLRFNGKVVKHVYQQVLGSFHAVSAGIFNNQKHTWNFASNVEHDSVAFELVVQFANRNDGLKFKSCLETLIHGKRTVTRRRRKSSFSLKKSPVIQMEGPSPINSVDANQIRLLSWTTTGVEWFQTSQSLFIGTFNVGDASPPKSQLEFWIPSNGYHSLVAIGIQEVSSRYDEWAKAISSHLGDVYVCMASVKMWEIGLLVYIKRDSMAHVSNITTGMEKTGIKVGNNMTSIQLGNKGGVGVGFKWHDVPICFINSHLAAQQNKVIQRNDNYFQIMKKLGIDATFHDSSFQGQAPLQVFEHVFFFGDLNYRVDIPFSEAAAYVKSKQHDKLFKHDQLDKEMKNSRVFVGFRTEPPQFAPTYRWKKGRSELSKKKDQPPSFTDRIMWYSMPGAVDDLKLDTYTSAPQLMVSDHRPVAGTFTLKLRHSYSWPMHPLNPYTSERPISSLLMRRNKPITEKFDLSSIGRESNLFLSRNSDPGSPCISFRKVNVFLNHQEDGQALPLWIRIGIQSPILNSRSLSSFAPGSEKKQRLSSASYAYQGTGRWGSLYYEFDSNLGLPILTPYVWDPVFLRTQHLLLSVICPASSKEEKNLSVAHNTLTSGDDAITPPSKSKTGAPPGHASVSLKHAIDSILARTSTSGFQNWSRDSVFWVPFLSQIYSGGEVIGKISGEMAMLPECFDNMPVVKPSLRKSTLIKSGFLHCTQSGDVDSLPTVLLIGMLFDNGDMIFLSSNGGDNVLFRVNVNSCDNVFPVNATFTLHNCFDYRFHKLITLELASENKSETADWLAALSSMLLGEKVHLIGAIPPPPLEKNVSVTPKKQQERRTTFLRTAPPPPPPPTE